ncbi:MAG: GIY-YIG nuclease family protein [bacterium]|nr:GIY-YIG nuclease family protein [bacterium]
MMNAYYVYIMASKRNGTLYAGVTNDLVKRVGQHKSDAIDGFTKRYKVHMLVYYEETSDVRTALAREKQVKQWHRVWKLQLIERQNPQWRDLYNDFIDPLDSGSSPE